MRDIFPVLQRFRNLLLGRQHRGTLRNPVDMASRDWDSKIPNLPRSTAENPKLADNDYYTRDPMRAVKHPTVIMDSAEDEKKDDLKVGDNDDKGANTSIAVMEGAQIRKTPGKVYKYSDMKSSNP